MKYMDIRPICLVSTVHKIEIVDNKKKMSTMSTGIFRKKTQAIIDYNLTMGGVDKADQCHSRTGQN